MNLPTGRQAKMRNDDPASSIQHQLFIGRSLTHFHIGSFGFSIFRFTFVNERSFIMKANRKEHITTIALELFAANGYGNTSIAAIANKAGVAQGLLYNFFPSKEALLHAILDKGFAEIKLSMEGYVREKDPQKAIINHIEQTFQLVEKNKHYWKLFHSIKLQDRVQEYLDSTYAGAKQFIIKTLSDNFRKLKYKSPVLEAKLFFAMMDGLVIHYLMDEAEFPLKEIKKHIINKYTL
ncbi:MAG: TetR/AcrR family transcriptional regulator [Chitinophagales bacterium]